MMLLKPQPEPDAFDRLVRIPGNKFLKGLSDAKPTDKQWSQNDYWKHIRSQLRESYSRICAYYMLIGFHQAHVFLMLITIYQNL